MSTFLQVRSQQVRGAAANRGQMGREGIMASGTLVRRGRRGIYHMVYVDPSSGRQVWRTTGTSKRRDAQMQLDELRHRLGLEGESHRPSREMELGEFVVSHWLPERCAVLKSSTRRQYEHTASVVVAWLGSTVTVRQALRVARVQAYVAHLVSLGRKPTTARCHLAVISSIATYAIELGYLGRNPIRGVVAPKVDRPDPIAYTADEVARVIRALPKDERDIAIVLFGTGLRRSELSPLRAGDYLPSETMVGKASCGRLRIERRAWRGHLDIPKTGIRTVTVGGAVEDVLRRRCEGKSPDDLLFPAVRGGLIDWDKWVRDTWMPALVRAGVAPMGVHACRRTAVTLTLAAAVPVQVAAKRFGMSPKTLIAHYAAVDQAASEQAALAMDGVLSPNGTALRAVS